MNISTGKVLTRNKVTTLPLPKIVKEKIEEMALKEGIVAVKFMNKGSIELLNVDQQVETQGDYF